MRSSYAKSASSLVRFAWGLVGVASVVAFARFTLPRLLGPASQRVQRGVE